MSATDAVRPLTQFKGMVDKELHQFEQTQSLASFAFPPLSAAQCDVVYALLPLPRFLFLLLTSAHAHAPPHTHTKDGNARRSTVWVRSWR